MRSEARENQFSSDKLLFHGNKAIDILQGHITSPSVYEISPVGYCNQKCSYCISQDFRAKNKLSDHQIKALLSQISKLGGKAITITGGGEPLLHPKIDLLIETAVSLELSVGVITNGTYTSDNWATVIAKHASFCRFSIDTIDPLKYKEIRGTNHLNRVLKNIQALTEQKERQGTKILIGVQVVWINQSFEAVREMATSFSQLGVDFLQIRPVDNVPSLAISPSLRIPENTKTFLSELQQELNRDGFKIIPSSGKWDEVFENRVGKQYIGCQGANLTASIGHDYKVYFCCSHIGNPLFCLGDLRNQTLSEILNSPKRMELINGVDHSLCQMQCRNHHLNNKLLDLQKIGIFRAKQKVNEAKTAPRPLHWEFL